MQLDLGGNSINDGCVESLVNGLVHCKRLRLLNLNSNEIGDNGLNMLIQGLPASVDTLELEGNQISLARQLPLTRFESFRFSHNALCDRGPGVIAASLADPNCQLRELNLNRTNIGDDGMITLAESLRGNQRLIRLALSDNNITDGWNALTSILCDTTSIEATHGSNHTLEYLGYDTGPLHVQEILRLNSGRDKSRVAAQKILQTHRHLNMRPLFDKKLGLLPSCSCVARSFC